LIHFKICADIASCAGRPLIYGLLAATDPVRLVFRSSLYRQYAADSITIQSFIRALKALRHPEAESPTQFGGRSYCLSTIVDMPPHETCFHDSEALHNDGAQQEWMRAAQESSTGPERDLRMGEEYWSYLGHDTSVSATRLSISRPAPTLPTIDVDLVYHI
jgi:hypothetical protein